MRNAVSSVGVFALVMVVIAGSASAHCQVPCGIYDDPLRVKLLEEHVTTIEKAMKSIGSLSADKQPDQNQITRWVMNKEKHADELAEIVTYYFMAQRVKPVDVRDKTAYAKYTTQLTTLHKIMIHAMKAKQSTDTTQVDELRKLIAAFKASYLG